MPRDHYSQIAKRFGFTVPDEYRELKKRGFLHLDEPAHSSAFTTPGSGYLWLNDMEWLEPAKIAAFEFEKHHLPGFVPFAFAGGGDLWCWQVDVTTTRGTRVMQCPHDYGLATVYAPDFAAALYRQVLDYACHGIQSADDVTEARAHLKRWSIDLACVFPKTWCERIAKIRGRELMAWDDCGYECVGLITEEELGQIEATDIACSEMGVEVEWMKG